MKEKRKILVVDDERDLCEILVFNLTQAGYEADAVYSAAQALEKGVANYHLLLLDVMMDGMNGFELARQLKADDRTRQVPIIFLTAKDAEADLLQGFALGCDDYVAKPFSIKEVMARVHAVLERTSAATGDDEVLQYNGLLMHTRSKSVTVDGATVSLTKTEYQLLHLLLSHQGEVFSRSEMISRVWPPNVVVTDRTVDVNITRLRKKVGQYAHHIVTRQGYGYVFEAVNH